jgi:hypothetical protein
MKQGSEVREFLRRFAQRFAFVIARRVARRLDKAEGHSPTIFPRRIFLRLYAMMVIEVKAKPPAMAATMREKILMGATYEVEETPCAREQ